MWQWHSGSGNDGSNVSGSCSTGGIFYDGGDAHGADDYAGLDDVGGGGGSGGGHKAHCNMMIRKEVMVMNFKRT